MEGYQVRPEELLETVHLGQICLGNWESLVQRME
jgi:hypothetical protein